MSGEHNANEPARTGRRINIDIRWSLHDTIAASIALCFIVYVASNALVQVYERKVIHVNKVLERDRERRAHEHACQPDVEAVVHEEVYD